MGETNLGARSEEMSQRGQERGAPVLERFRLHRPLGRRTELTPLAVFLCLGVALLAFVTAINQVCNYDIWWHLRSGLWTLENGRIPREDTFTLEER